MRQNTDKKETARAAFQDFIRARYGIELGSVPNDFQRSFYLTQFYIREIHNELRTPISDDEIDAGFTDGAHDVGADFIYRDDGQVHILQSKYKKAGNGVTLEEIQHFQSILRRLRSPEWRKNSRVKELLSDVDWKRDTFSLRFVALGPIENQAKLQEGEPLALPDDVPGLADRVSIEYLSESALTEEIRDARFADNKDVEIVLHSYGGRNRRKNIIEIESGEHRSFILTVGAQQIVNMHKKAKGDALFTWNIRNFIGNTKTNKDIRLTAEKNAPHFFLFNNGISCLARKVTVSEDGAALTTVGLQVINGAQTVKALYKASHEGFKSGEPVVLVRITEVDKNYGVTGSFSSQITRFNNTQNVIKVSDFRSNDQIQIDLQKKFKYGRFGKDVRYYPKRTDNRAPNTTAIRLEEFAKVIYAFLFDPVKFSGSTSFLFDDTENGGYAKVFGNGVDVPEIMPEEEFRLRSAIWWISEAFDAELKEVKKGEISQLERAALERKWFLLYAARLVLQKSFGEEDYKRELLKHYKGEWKFDQDEVGDWFRDLFNIAKQSVVYVYKAAQKQENFVHRNWMRSQRSADDLKDFILDSPTQGLRSLKGAKGK